MAGCAIIDAPRVGCPNQFGAAVGAADPNQFGETVEAADPNQFGETGSGSGATGAASTTSEPTL